MKDIDVIIKQYKNAAILHGFAIQNGDYKTANRNAHVLKKIYYKLQKSPNLKTKILKLLLADKDPSIATWTAAHCLGLDIYKNDAIKTLKKLSRYKDIGILRFNAEMTLKVYKQQGYLKF